MSLVWFAALWVSAYLALRRRCRLRGDDAWLYSGLLAFSEAILATMTLGLLGLLQTWPLTLLSAALAFGHFAAARGRRGARRRFSRARRDWRWLALPGAAAAAIAGLRLVLAALSPPDSWDGLSYHLPIALRWLQQGNLDLAGWYGTERYYAWNVELFTTWLAAVDGGTLGAAKMCQAFGLPLLAAAGAALGRRLAGSRWAGACALALATVPMGVIQSGVPYVDLLHAAFWAAAASAGAACLRSPRRLHFIAGAAAFGLTLGSKSTIYFAFILLIPPALAAAASEKRRRELVKALPACVALAVVLGLASFLRNWWQAANPIFPFALTLGGREIFAGPLTPRDLLITMETWFVSRPVQWLWYPLHERVLGSAQYTYENGFGPLFAAGWVLWPFSCWRAWKSKDRAAGAFLGMLALAAAMFMLLQPVRAPRYALFAVCMPVVGAAYALKTARGPALWAARSLWTVGLLWGMLGVVAHLGRGDGPLAVWQSLRAGVRLSAEDYYKRVFLSQGEAWAGLNAKLQPGDVVAVNYGELLLPWAGLPPRARPIVVRSEPTDYPGAHFAVTADDWVAVLEGLRARWVVLWSPRWYPQQSDRERAWLKQRPRRFSPVGRWESSAMGRVDVYEFL